MENIDTKKLRKLTINVEIIRGGAIILGGGNYFGGGGYVTSVYCYRRYTAVRFTGIMAIISLSFYLNSKKCSQTKNRHNVCARKIGYRLDFNIIEHC